MRRAVLYSMILTGSWLGFAGCDPDEGSPHETTMHQGPSQTEDDAGGDRALGVDASDVWDSGHDGEPDANSGQTGASTTDASISPPSSPIDARDAGYSPCPGNGEPCKILPLGDSITYGIGASGGYRVELFRKARAANQDITFVGSVQSGPMTVDGASFPRSNEGHSGWTISQIASLVPDPALDQKPDIVLLMAGTNDVNLSQDLPNAPARLGALIDKLVAADEHTLIVVAQITPLTASFFGSDRDAQVQTFNRALRDVVASRAAAGKHVLLLDMYSGFPETGLGDGVHPNQQGYAWMAEVWYEAIGPVLR